MLMLSTCQRARISSYSITLAKWICFLTAEIILLLLVLTEKKPQNSFCLIKEKKPYKSKRLSNSKSSDLVLFLFVSCLGKPIYFAEAILFS